MVLPLIVISLLFCVLADGQRHDIVRDKKVPLFTTDCGRQIVLDSRIYNGSISTPGRYPWMAIFFNFRADMTISHLCTGSVITPYHILTAAHCFDDNDPDQATVRVGDYDLDRDTDLPPGSTVDISMQAIKCHPGYDGNSFANDICVVTLARPLTYSRYIQPICLPFEYRSETFAGREAYVAGWGAIKSDGPASSVLLANKLDVLSTAECDVFMAQAKRKVLPSQLCAGHPSKGKDSCYSDSGGPLMLPISNRFYQIGIVSAGMGCGHPRYPGLYTKVTHLLDWVLYTVLNN